MRFTGKVAIITGAASGIGLATAKNLESQGASIVMADLNIEDSLTESVLALNCDVSSEEQVKRVTTKTLERFGKMDIIVNNAGTMIFKALVDHTLDDWWKVLSVDLLGSFLFTKEAFLHMKPGGAIVNVSSIHAVETTPLVASYAAGKAALLSLTRSSAIEGKMKGIRVNAVLPGAIETTMLRNNPNIKAGLETIRKGDVGTPEDVAMAIAYLASDEAKFIQGSSIMVDGGRLAGL